MNPKEKIYDQRTFDEEHLTCPNCGWDGTGDQAHVAGFYGIGKFKEVLCPQCNEYLGNLSRERSLKFTWNDCDSYSYASSL